MTRSEALEQLGRAIDEVDNLAHALQLPLPALNHVDHQKRLLPEKVAKLRAAYKALGGES